MSYIYNDVACCENCSNNPVNNPYASGICCCSLPYVSPMPLRHWTKPRDYREKTAYTITTSADSIPNKMKSQQ